MPQTRDSWVDVTKGVAIVGVVLFHAVSLATAAGPDRLWTAAGYGLFAFIMPVFFMMSGLFAGRHLDLPWPEYLRARVWPIAYLWVAWGLLYAGLHAVTDGRLGGTLWHTISLQTTLWYLAALAMYLVIARAVRDVPSWLQIAGATVVAAPFAIWFPFDAWGLGHTPHFYVAFAVATLFPARLLAWGRSVTWRMVPGLLMASAVLGAAVLAAPETRSVVYALSPLLVVPIVFALCRLLTSTGRTAEAFAALGVQSLAIYLIHPIVLETFGAIVGDSDTALGVTFPIGATLASVALGYLIGRTLGRAPWIFAPPPRRAERLSAP
ncbi:acyltransferase family protein [Aeromicrobium sp. S22]|uniref:acyltransferase family protein n=1 Tax=Aeromicrobium sp. S22 TaxID=2662029 RepID=UPI00129E799F|nr:acyltransferase family protein [Aeromicrobium sp. S22]MRJ99902.1 acyltransferase family protein [Aeromicrobium sp. S22]